MRILNLKDKDIYLTYSWGNFNHGVCGHVYEVIDYYFILKNYFSVGCFFPELNAKILKDAIISKYDFTENEIDDFLNNCKFNDNINPMIIQANDILFVDGNYKNIKKLTFYVKHLFMFACGDKEFNDLPNNWFVLLDFRVYQIPEKSKKNHIDYIKKILFKNLKKIYKSEERTLLYITENCRNMTDQELDILTDSENFLVVKNTKPTLFKENIEYYNPPIDNIFEKFTKYCYTPINRKWDCSPRFIAECAYYKKEIQYYNIDYYDIDLGLYYRKYDIENNFNQLFLDNDDEIIEILKETNEFK